MVTRERGKYGWLTKVMVRVSCVLDSSKFHSKLHYVHRLDELRHLIPLDHVYICDEVKRYTPRPTHAADGCLPTTVFPMLIILKTS